MDDRVEIVDHCKISEDHVDIGAATLFVFFTSSAHVNMGSVES